MGKLPSLLYEFSGRTHTAHSFLPKNRSQETSSIREKGLIDSKLMTLFYIINFFSIKVPEFQLLAVVVHDRILSKAGVQDLVNMPDLATQRAELSTLLSFNQRKTLSLLGANQQSLSTNLDQYVKDRTT